ncbi:MAG: hypothetical protein K6E50_01790 [Lachnospiraceae bacterium]|nr:hypothetical protein [Lachnospiraceae bacterium]
MTILLAAVLAVIAGFFGSALPVRAEEYWEKNKESGYEVVIDDGEELLDPDELEDLAELMYKISEYGNVVFYTCSESGQALEKEADSRADEYYYSLFRDENGVIFIIDFDYGHNADEHCMLWTNTYGELEKKLTASKLNSMLDNTFNNAGYHDWKGYADETFGQILEYFETGKLAEPMKWIVNIFLAIILSLMLNFAFVSYSIRSKEPNAKELLAGMYQKFQMGDPHMVLTSTTKVYDPPSSSSGGGGRSGGGGGGGHSHSGGGHRA